jgi:AAA domain
MALNVSTARVAKPRRTFLYGPGGIGKSTFAAQAPSCVFIPTEEGANDIEVAKFPLCHSFDQVMGCIGQLYQEPHEFRSLCIDTLDWLEKQIWAAIAHQNGVEQIGDIKYGRGYGFSVGYFRQLLQALDALREVRGMSIFLLAHAKAEKFEDPEYPSYDRYEPKMHEHVTSLLIEWSDEVFFADFKKVVSQEDAGFNRTIGKAKGTGQRIMRCTARPAAIAKNRLAMPDEIPFDYSEYSKYLPK